MSHHEIRVGEYNVSYFVGGTGKPIVIVHGGGDGASIWLDTVAGLARYYRVYLPDLPGYGDSQPMSDQFHLSEYVNFVGRFADSVGLERFYLVGHSIGGSIALNFALKHPERVEKLVLVSSLGLGAKVGLWVRLVSLPALFKPVSRALHALMRAVGWVTKRVFASIFINPLPPVKIDMGRYVASLKRQAPVSDSLYSLKMPTLLVWGAKDNVVPVTAAYKAARLIPDCRLQVFENCGHSVYRQSRHEFSRTLLKFLGQGQPAPAEALSKPAPSFADAPAGRIAALRRLLAQRRSAEFADTAALLAAAALILTITKSR